MQINGAHLTTAFIPKSFEFQDKVRAPVTIDVAARFDIDESLQSTQDRQQNQQVTSVDDVQQSRFVRLFSTTNNSSQSQLEIIPLPRSVQQYEQVANLKSESQRLFDETV